MRHVSRGHPSVPLNLRTLTFIVVPVVVGENLCIASRSAPSGRVQISALLVRVSADWIDPPALMRQRPSGIDVSMTGFMADPVAGRSDACRTFHRARFLSLSEISPATRIVN